MKEIEFRTAASARGALLFMANVPGVALGDRVQVRDRHGNIRNGQVIQTTTELVMVQVFEGTDDLDLESTWVRFLERPFEVALSPDILGRVFNGVGQPRDGRPPIVSSRHANVNGAPVNPTARAYPREFMQTGVSTIDGLNSLVRGQKLPIFSGSGLPHNRLAAQIVRQAKLPGEESNFAIVFAAMGVSHTDARFFQENFANSGVLGNVVMFTNLADDPPIERLILPRAALTAAEYLAFELDRHVLVVLTDMTHYAEALREVATAKGDVPARKGYPGYLYSDLAEIYERAGRIKNRHGSITMVPVLSMPSDDITHPIPDLTGYITEGQIVLSRDLHNQGIYPPVTIMPSLSRLMKDGIGKDDTREDHARVSSRLYASYARAIEARNLASIIGAEELSRRDRQYLHFADEFERRFVGQGEDEDRSIIETLDLAWDLLSLLPPDALSRVSEADLAKYHHRGPDGAGPEEPQWQSA
jgi:V/A-type H+-transporting ATPase subunit B